jgi:hypothetical protein
MWRTIGLFLLLPVIFVYWAVTSVGSAIDKALGGP